MSRNYIVYIFLLLSFSSKVYSQVGINTTNPLQLLHIEGGSMAVTTDDVVVTSSGNVGIGNVAPTSKLDIKGSLHYEDGTLNLSGKNLVSDSNGNATWRLLPLAFAEKTAVWTLSGSVTIPSDGFAQGRLTGTSVVSNDGVNLIPSGTDRVKVPKGRYLMFVSGDIVGNEYVVLYVYNAATNTPLYTTIYFYELPSSTTYIEFPSDTNIFINLVSYGATRVVPTTTTSNFYMVAPYTAAATYSITFLALE